LAEENCGAVQDDDILFITTSLRIPLAELRFRFARSGGPGGQHVNKAETSVELLWDVANSPSLTEDQRARILEKLKNAIDQTGTLHLVASESRSQHRNRQAAVNRLRNLLRRAVRVPKRRRPTRPSRAARERRLQRKQQRSDTKRLRRPPSRDE
jgi:ribosome-associated protein